MSKPHIKDMLKWAYPYAVLNNIPNTAEFLVPREQIGITPAHYLLGTIWMLCTHDNLYAHWKAKYMDQYTWKEFAELTKDWLPDSRATDCQGLNDAFFRYIWEGGDHTTDISANACYLNWCEERGVITDRKQLKLGYAVFKDKDGKKTHIGYICGFDRGEPLVLEAQGFKWGVRINYLKDRPFTYYGVMSKVYDYSEKTSIYPDTPLSLTPTQRGTAYAKLQEAMNYLGYKDDEGKPLTVDGVFGKRSREAFERMVVLNTEQPEAASIEICTYPLAITVNGSVLYE